MKILYFVHGKPDAEQAEEIQQLGALVRNADVWHTSDFIEACDAVAGAVPAGYAHIKRVDTKPKKASKPKDAA